MTEFARGGGVSIDTVDLLLAVKLGPGQALLNELLLRRLAAARAAAEGITVTPEELSEGADAFFSENDLFEAPQIEAWMSVRKIARADLDAWLRESLLRDKLRAAMISDEAVLKHFQSSMHDYAQADVESVGFESEGAAAEILLQLKESELTWAQAAEEAGGMDSSTVRRSEAPEDIASLLFASAPGAFVGPVETDDGDYAIYRLLSRRDPELDDDLREEIRDRLFREDLVRALARDPLVLTA